MKSIFLFILLLFSFICKSQFNYSALNSENIPGAYIDLGMQGVIIDQNSNGNPINYDDDVSAVYNLGFDFILEDSSFNQFVLSTNGYIKLGNQNPSPTSYDFNISTETFFISPFNYNLIGGTNPEYRVFTSGIAPTRICTIQFKNVRDKHTSLGQYSDINFQIKIFETTNNVEFVYGTFTPSINPPLFFSGHVGIRGSITSQVGIFKSSSQLWSTAEFGNGVGNASFNTKNNVLPDLGRTFRFLSSVLPINLSSFTAKNTGKHNLLFWITSMEHNSKEFIVERSTEGTQFYKIGKIQAVGNSNYNNQYSFNDINPILGHNYYRLKMVDIDNSYKYSEVRLVRFNQKRINIYPNPVQNELRISGLENEIGNVFIYNSLGELLFHKKQQVSEVIDLNFLPRGNYKVRIELKNEIITEQILKQ